MTTTSHVSNYSQVLDAYKSYMTKVAELMGGSPAKVEEEMKDVMEFERRLAEVS